MSRFFWHFVASAAHLAVDYKNLPVTNPASPNRLTEVSDTISTTFGY
jgi:hypothetical protein